MTTDTKAAHTPGPWELLPTETEGDLRGTTIVGSNLGGLVGMVMPWPTEIDSGDYRRVEANARLIAAAPELLEACEGMLPKNVCLTNNRWSDDTNVPLGVSLGDLRKLAALIVKARGEA